MTDDSIGRLLARLASPDPGAAWSEFLQRYSATLLQIVRRCEADPQRVGECFDHVCQALSDDHFRRLRAYRNDGPAQFRTWLMAVVANLCTDWHRKRRGRYRPLRAVAQLPELEQLVYRCIFVRGMTRVECLRALEHRYPTLTEQQLSEVNARLFARLPPQRRWQLGTRMATIGPQGETLTRDLADDALQLEDVGPGPEAIAQTTQEHEWLAKAMAELPTQQRLLLRLRFEQNLTLAEVARLTGLQDPFRAHRQIQAALKKIAEAMNCPVRASDRKTR
jgi:RNA polymerase sigma factor (sigma-70 family)